MRSATHTEKERQKEAATIQPLCEGQAVQRHNGRWSGAGTGRGAVREGHSFKW